ncbi:hypothetical protein BDZ91DRAFT_800597 [Kalaharituber pfeilii]|nr:hypothetical protein BDZ91DRAFT_800597 [Kalaharituber pfeilii]
MENTNRRGRPPKPVEAAPHWRTLAAREEAAPKLVEIMEKINQHFGGIRGFLNAWTENDQTKVSRNNFMRSGACEIVSLWLPLMDKVPEEMLLDNVISLCDKEIKNVLDDQSSILRYVRKDIEKDSEGAITKSLDDMEEVARMSLPTLWKILERVTLIRGSSEEAQIKRRSGVKKVITCSIMCILNARNQKVNAFQTLMGVFLHASHLQKSGIEVLHGLGMTCSYNHLIGAMRKLASDLRKDLKLTSAVYPMKINIDNVNQKVGVRDGSSTRMSMIDNSTGGFATKVVGVPPGTRRIPREWLSATKRVSLDPRDLAPSDAALDFMCHYRKYYMEELLERMVVRGIAIGQKTEKLFEKPRVEVLYMESAKIYPLDLMAIEQASTTGNLESIKRCLSKDLGYTNQDLMKGIYLVGGDHLLVSRVKSIQRLRESDVPGEDFKFVLPLLGPLHTAMNFMKMIMKKHLGPRDGSVPGSLQYMNKKLRRQYIDEDATNLWACMDICKDALDGCLIALMVRASDCASIDDFRSRIVTGECKIEEIVGKLDSMLEYSYVPICQMKDYEERDVILENLLLFTRQALEFRAYYKSMRGGDVGAMQLMLELWGPQFIGNRQMNYGDALMDIRVGMEAEWSEELKKIVRANWVINPWGQTGKTLGMDEFMEELVRSLKDIYNPGGSDTLDNFMREVTCRCVVFFMRIKDDMRRGMGLRRRAGNHVKQDRGPDILALVDFLLSEKVTEFVAGRGAPGTGMVHECRDMMEAGLARMVDGVWWNDYLMRSPGCARVSILQSLGSREKSPEDIDLEEIGIVN